MATLENLIDSIRAATAIDASQKVTDTVIKLFVNQEYPALRRRVADLSPGCADLFTKVALFDVGAGESTWTITDEVSDLGKIRKVGRRAGSGAPYIRLPRAPFGNAAHVGELSWRPRGVILEFFPASAAPSGGVADAYQLTYVAKPTLLEEDEDLVELPDGVERILVQLGSAKVRIRLGDDPTPHLKLAAAAWEEEKVSLAEQYPGTPEAFDDVTGWY